MGPPTAHQGTERRKYGSTGARPLDDLAAGCCPTLAPPLSPPNVPKCVGQRDVNHSSTLDTRRTAGW